MNTREQHSTQAVVNKLNEIKNAVKGNSISTETIETSSTGTIKGRISKVAIYVSGASDGEFTVGSNSAMTAYSGVSYVIGGDTNDLIIDDIAYDASGTEFQIIVTRR